MNRLLLCLSTLALSFVFSLQAMAQTLFIPHLTGGESEWIDVLEVTNYGTGAPSFTLTLYDGDDPVYSQLLYPASLGYMSVNLTEKAPTATCGVIEYAGPHLDFRISYQNTSPAGGGVAQFRVTNSTSEALGFSFADFDEAVTWKGLALMNTGYTDLAVDLYAIGGGQVLGNCTVTIPSRSRISGVHSTYFPSLSVSEVEAIVAQAGIQNLSGISISGDTDLGELLFTPARGQSVGHFGAALTLSSSDFSEGGVIPDKCSRLGDNLSPYLNWYNVPEGTKSFALLMETVDETHRYNDYWVVYDIPVARFNLPGGIPAGASISGGGTQGTGWSGTNGYFGPDAQNSYRFKLYALDTELDLPAGALGVDVKQAMSGHVLGQDELIGTWSP